MQLKVSLFLVLIYFFFQFLSAQDKPIVNDTIKEQHLLPGVVVHGDNIQTKFKTIPVDVIEVDDTYLNANRSNSLMTSLEKIPGLGAMQIGQGQSKPVIRGLGFNRVAVLQAGVKQQGQQWGADHGLEIDQYDVDRIQIYKGAMSLQLGSDAIAGALVVPHATLRRKDGFHIKTLLNGATNNLLFGGSVSAEWQKEQYYLRVRSTYQNSEAYKVPTGEFNYLGYIFPLKNHRLKNTAGREMNFSLQTGHIGENIATRFLISNVYSKTGFFAGAHGIPTYIDMQDNGKYRKIGLPYQRINHFKLLYNQEIQLSNRWKWSSDLGYQNNNRREFSNPHTHGYGKIPNTDVELELKLQTLTFNPQLAYQFSDYSKLQFGVNSEYQNNRIGGYSFLLPKFQQYTIGGYVINTTILSSSLVLTSGIRYDWGYLNIHEYIDENLPEEYQMRAESLTKRMGSTSFSGGLSYIMNKEWNFKMNIGRSFRMPTANELSSNGVHHGTFRHELGDRNLKPETSYQVDVVADFVKSLADDVSRVSINASGFVNYFPNFIFLNPTGRFSWLPDAGQYYQYQQAKAIRMGGELSAKLDVNKYFSWGASLEYVYAQDTDNEKPIPFTPPMSIINELYIKYPKLVLLTNFELILSYRYVDAQNRVATNEKTTPSYNLFDTSLSFDLPTAFGKSQFSIQVQNIFDKKYYNHLSFYRTLDIPEIGRNIRFSFQLTI